MDFGGGENGGYSLSGAVTPVSRHPSISEADESVFVEELRHKASGLFGRKRVAEIELHIPCEPSPNLSTRSNLVLNSQSCCDSLELNYADEEGGSRSSEEMSALLGTDFMEEIITVGHEVDQQFRENESAIKLKSDSNRNERFLADADQESNVDSNGSQQVMNKGNGVVNCFVIDTTACN